MKKLTVFWLVLIAFAVTLNMGSDPPLAGVPNGTGVDRFNYKHKDSVTVDSQYTGNWEPVDSMVVTIADSGYIVITVSGIVTLEPPFESFYIGLGNDSANRVSAALAATTGQTHTNLDTFTITVPGDVKNAMKIPFTFMWIDSGAVATAAGKTDTFYFNWATGSSASRVFVEDIWFRADEIVQDSAL